MKATQLATVCIVCLLGIFPAVASAQPFVPLPDDASQVTDLKTSLIWRRCAEGFVFNATANTCTVNAPATLFTHEAALQQVTTVNKLVTISSNLWRLPNIKELASIADKSVGNPAIDGNAFPNTPPNWFWSSSPDVAGPTIAWVVFFDVGYVSNSYRTGSGYVRLVRAGQ